MKSLKTICVLLLALMVLTAMVACEDKEGFTDLFPSRPPNPSAAPESTGNGVMSEKASSAPETTPSRAAPETQRMTVVRCTQNDDGAWGLFVTGENYGLSTLGCDTVDETNGKLSSGAVIDVRGIETERLTYPSQLVGEHISITVVEPGEDLIGLYQEILEFIYDELPEMNPAPEHPELDLDSIFGFDFSEVHNLSQEEKDALAYFFSCNHNTVTTQFVSREELRRQGYLTGEGTPWENGVLFIIKDEKLSGDSFSFSVGKWRGGMETNTRKGFTARRTAEGWVFDVPETEWCSE